MSVTVALISASQSRTVRHGTLRFDRKRFEDDISSHTNLNINVRVIFVYVSTWTDDIQNSDCIASYANHIIVLKYIINISIGC